MIKKLYKTIQWNIVVKLGKIFASVLQRYPMFAAACEAAANEGRSPAPICRTLDPKGQPVSTLNRFPVTPEEVDQFERETKDWNPELPDDLKSFWTIAVRGYLLSEVIEGKREFRIAMQDDRKFIIHPLGKNGKTLDWSL